MTDAAEKLKCLTDTFFSTWKLDEDEYLNKVLLVVSSPNSFVSDLHFLKEDIVPRKQAEFLEALAVYHRDASELAKPPEEEEEPGADPEEVKAKVKELTLSLFETWKLDESEFLEKTLQVLSSPTVAVTELHFLKEDVVPRKQAEFMEALGAYHKEVSAELARLVPSGGRGSQAEPDPLLEEQPTDVVSPDSLADTGIPFFLRVENENAYMLLHKWFLHTSGWTSNHFPSSMASWDDVVKDPDNFVLGRWLLQRVPGSSDRYTMSPWSIPENFIDFYGFARPRVESKIDIQFRVESQGAGYCLTWIKEKRKLRRDDRQVQTILSERCGTSPWDLKSTTWYFVRAPCKTRKRIPQIEFFVNTQMPFILSCDISGTSIWNNLGMGGNLDATTDLKEGKRFRLVRAMWEGKPGYRLVDVNTGSALCWAYAILERGNSKNMHVVEEQKAGQFDARSFLKIEPGYAPGFVNFHFVQADCHLSTATMTVDRKGLILMTSNKIYSSSEATMKQNGFMFLPYSPNPSDWPADPNLSELPFCLRWGTNFGQNQPSVYIGAETLPLVPGTKLVLTYWTSRPGCTYFVEPCKEKPKFFRLVCADKPSLCMCVESIDEDTIVTLTDKRGDNTLLTCELNQCGVWHNACHHYKFECSDLYLNIRTKGWTPATVIGSYIVQNCKLTNTTSHEKSGFRLVNGGMNIDMGRRPNGDLRQIYAELYPAEEILCVCGDHFETKEEEQEHKNSCKAHKPVPRQCPACNGNFWDFGPNSWTEHAEVCVKGIHLARPNECKTCTMLFNSETSLTEHRCPGSAVTIAPPDQPRWAYVYGFTEADVVHLRGREGASATTTTTATSKSTHEQDPAVVEANQSKLVSARSGCGVTCSDILVCGACKKARKVSYCMFCGDGHQNERAKACGSCREKQGGGWGKVTGKPKHISAGCIHCGTHSGLAFYSVCLPCRKLYGAKCFYNYCSGM